MIIKREINDFYSLKDELWSGAIQTMETIEEHDMEDEFMDYSLSDTSARASSISYLYQPFSYFI